MDKVRSLRPHTRTGSIYVLANLLNPLVRGWQNYYCALNKWDLNKIWRFINRRLEKWCKWNRRMNLYKSLRWLNTFYNMQPGLLPIGVYARLINLENVFLKSRMNREVHVRFCEEQGVKIPLLSRLVAGFLLVSRFLSFQFHHLSFSFLWSSFGVTFVDNQNKFVLNGIDLDKVYSQASLERQFKSTH